MRTRQEVEDLIRGLTLLGTGGGGRPDRGRAYLLPHVESGVGVGWVDVADIADDAWVCTTFGMGSIAPTPPMTADERHALGYGAPAVEQPMAVAVAALAAITGRAITAVVPFELGAGNASGPLDTAVRLHLRCVDADLCGRAVPELTQTTAALAGVPLCPVAICDSWGNRLVLLAAHSLALAERLGKQVSLVTRLPDAGLTCAHAGYLMTGATLRRIAVPGTLSLALRVGRMIREAASANRDPLAAAAAAVGGKILFVGQVIEKAWESRDGYMIGTTYVQGQETDAGHQLRIWFKNENHLAWVDDEPVASSPDLIMVLDRRTGEPFTNTDLPEGGSIGVLAARAPLVWQSPEGLAALGPGHFGFAIPYRPVVPQAPGR
jgi:DUF917 family protein